MRDADTGTLKPIPQLNGIMRPDVWDHHRVAYVTLASSRYRTATSRRTPWRTR
jgi:hypothetical protein